LVGLPECVFLLDHFAAPYRRVQSTVRGGVLETVAAAVLARVKVLCGCLSQRREPASNAGRHRRVAATCLAR
jgi:hypothetical protein